MAVINGTNGDNVLIDTAGDDTIDAKGGNDTITVSGGIDSVQGGSGTDTLILDYADEVIGFSNATFAGFDGGFSRSDGLVSVRFTGIERLIITTGSGNDSITGMAGADVIKTGGGDDTLIGGDGDDYLDGGSGGDNHLGGAGNDTIRVSDGADAVEGGADFDTLVVDYSGDTGGIFDQGFSGYEGGFGSNNNGIRSVRFTGIERIVITTGSGNDTITTGAADDIVTLNDGNDFANVGAGVNIADGGTGLDGFSADFSALTGPVSINLQNAVSAGAFGSYSNFEYFGTVTGTTRGDTFVTTAASVGETIVLGAGNDNATVINGADVVDGGVDSDTLTIDYSADTGGIFNQGFSGFEGGFGSNNNGLRSVRYSGIERLLITTGSGNDAITVGAADDTVSLGLGDDFTNVGAGRNIADGGGGVDGVSADFSARTAGVTIDLRNAVSAGAFGSYSNFEYFGTVTGTAFADTFVTTGVGASETFILGAGNDNVTVVNGPDVVDGGADFDTLTVDYSTDTGGIGDQGFSGFERGYSSNNSGVRSVRWNGIERLIVTTGSGSDAITTGTGADVVSLGLGDDFVNLVSGDDSADGGGGIDGFSADFSPRAAGIAINLQANTSTANAFFNFEFVGTITGTSFGDTIVTAAQQRDETLNLGAGDNQATVVNGADSFTAGAGFDTLTVDYSTDAGGIIDQGFSGFEGGFSSNNSGVRSVRFTGVDRFVITTGGGNDVITTRAANDVVSLGAGNDFTNVGAGVNTADGGADVDGFSADFSAIGSGVTINLQNAVSAGAFGSYSNFEYFGTITGSAFADTFVGTAVGAGELLLLGAGNDNVTVVNGPDSVDAGADFDTLTVDYSTDTGGIGNQGFSGWEGGFSSNNSGVRSVRFSGVERFIITTGAGADNITTGAADDIVTLGDNNDFTNVGAGVNTADGGAGSDGLSADFSAMAARVSIDLRNAVSAGAFGSYSNFEFFGTVIGSAFSDTFVGTDTGNGETFVLGAGDDNVTVVNGPDVVDAGSGFDTLTIDYSTDTGGVGNQGFSGFEGGFSSNNSGVRSVRFSGVERVIVTTGSGADNITTGAANDEIRTGAANDVLNGGDGDDFLDGGANDDAMSGGRGADVYVVDSLADTVNEAAAAGIDEVRTGLATYSLATLGNVEDLTGTATTGQTLTGNVANNRITGSTGADTLDGGDGRDVLLGGAGVDTATGGQGADVLISGAVTGPNLLRNGGFETQDGTNRSGDFVRAAPEDYNGAPYRFASVLDGWTSASGAGFEFNTAGSNPGTNVADGDVALDMEINPGQNVTLYQDIAGLVPATEMLLTFAAGLPTGGSLGANPTAVLQVVWNGQVIGTITPGSTTQENYSFVVTAIANGIGIGGANRLEFREIGSGSDARGTILDRVSLQTIVMDGDADTLSGGTDDDVYVVGAGDVVTEAPGGGVDLVRSSVSYTLATDLENLTLIGTGAINGTGNAGANVITGNTAANAIDGGAGADTLIGLAGNDTYTVDDAGDMVVEAAGGGIDLVRSAITYSLGAELENLTLIGGQAIDGTGNAGANVITGNGAANTLNGAGGADSLNGLGGNDTYIVDDAAVTVSEAGGGGTDLVRSSVSFTLAAQIENLTLTGGLAINGTGNGDVNVITGNAAANTLDGAGGADTLAGLGGDDTYVVDDAGDTVSEDIGGGTDLVRSSVTFTLGAEVENLTLTGTATINGTGNAGANTIVGNGVANTIEGGGGDDMLDGGAGIDIASYAGATSAVTVSLSTTAAQATGGAGSDTLVRFEGLTGSAFADTLTGNSGANRLSGGDGNDTLIGAGGDDTMLGGTGSDTAVFSGGFADYDIVQTGTGAYTVTDRRTGAPTGVDSLASVEKVRIANGTFNIADAVNVGPNGVDDGVGGLIEAGVGQPGVATASGNVLANDTDANLAIAALGEQLTVTGARVGAIGGYTAVTGSTVLQGVYGDLTIAVDGSYSYQLRDDRPATDALAPGQTAEDVFGYTLADTHGASSSARIVIDITGSSDAVAGGDALLTTIGRASALSAAVLLGNDMGGGDPPETFTVTSVSNAVGATVSLVNGILIITIAGASATFDYTITGANGDTTTGTATVTGVATANNGVTLTATSQFVAADLQGGNGRDTLTGAAGADHLVGGNNIDRLDGGAGADVMEGGAGKDVYIVDNVGDLVVELAGGGNDTVQTALAMYTLADQVERLTYTGAGTFTGTGNAIGNVITGGAGNDVLSGGDANDTLLGGLGDDRLEGGAGLDTASYAGITAGVTVDLRIGVAQATGGAGSDTLVGIERLIGTNFADTLIGDDLANFLTGGGQRDTLTGNGGKDRLDGGAAADILTGGGQADAFVFTELASFASGATLDRITDFTRAQGDKIDLTEFDADATLAGVQGFTFIGTNAFTGAGGANYELRYQAASNGDLLVQGDLNHDGAVDFSFLVHAVDLQASDFGVI